jgi:hypothetical protein
VQTQIQIPGTRGCLTKTPNLVPGVTKFALGAKNLFICQGLEKNKVKFFVVLNIEGFIPTKIATLNLSARDVGNRTGITKTIMHMNTVQSNVGRNIKTLQQLVLYAVVGMK